ncbi:MAG: DNA-formamidopyrimidine glycosylase family protein, partial [Hyphomicrobiaceae bacterium]
MPELPEVETVRRGLAGAMEGASFDVVERRRPDLRFPFPTRFAERLEGQRLDRLGRRAKYLCGHLSGGDVLIMHLGMSGRFLVHWPDRDPDHLGEFDHETGNDPAHDHVVFRMSSGAIVTYNDPRRFGFMDIVPADALETCRHFADMGVEPLGNELHPGYLAARARGRSADLKAFLLDQRNIAGLGNIYVCEALYRSGL